MDAMKLSVVIPVYNEVGTVKQIVEAVKKAPVDELEIIVVDDHSTDGTIDVLQQEVEPMVDRVFYHDINRGKGAALRTGFAEVTGDVVVIQDADLEYDPQDYEILLEPIRVGRADVVFGSRFIGGRPHRVVYFWHMVGNRVLTLLSNMATNLNLTDMETCYKMMRKEVLDSLDLEEDIKLPCQAKKRVKYLTLSQAADLLLDILTPANPCIDRRKVLRSPHIAYFETLFILPKVRRQKPALACLPIVDTDTIAAFEIHETDDDIPGETIDLGIDPRRRRCVCLWRVAELHPGAQSHTL